mmetsp:Transcript_22840/g.55057  ORF Transcript_22840/g.55057 Transcript_22840/m.55057 type:complete len:286 (-) Transcript_22840:1140-1997(-)
MHPHPIPVHEYLARGRLCDDRGQDVREVLRAEFLEEFHDGHLGRPRGDVRHERHVLDEAHGLSFGRLGWADHPPVGVVELAGLGLLARTGEGGVGTTEMGEGGGVGEAVQDLGYAGLGGIALVAPISSGKAVLQPVRYVVALDRRPDVKMLPLVQTPLQVPPHVLGQFTKQYPKQSPQQRSRQVQPLLPEVIPIVLRGPTQLAHEKFVNRISHEKSLLGLAVLLRADVGQDLLLQYPRRVPYAIVLRDIACGSPPSNEIERHLLLLDDEGFLEGGTEEVHHLPVR